MSGAKPRKVRGILGVPKPARPMLFNFQGNKASEWPSDDSDSDYAPPSDDETTTVEIW